MYTYINTHIYIYTHIYMYTYKYIYIRECMYARVMAHVCTSIHPRGSSKSMLYVKNITVKNITATHCNTLQHTATQQRICVVCQKYIQLRHVYKSCQT